MPIPFHLFQGSSFHPSGEEPKSALHETLRMYECGMFALAYFFHDALSFLYHSTAAPTCCPPFLLAVLGLFQVPVQAQDRQRLTAT